MVRSSRASRLVLDALADGKIRTMRELTDLGVSPQTLRRMVADGRISAPALGLYQSVNPPFDEREQFAAVTRLSPSCVVWLLSAAAIHRITEVMPSDIWIAVPANHRGSVEMGLATVRATRLSRPSDLAVGIEVINVHGVDVRVTSPARTVVDLWRYSTLNRSLQAQFQKVDDATFLDALANYLSPHRGGGEVADLADMAERLGVLDAMEPQLKMASFLAPSAGP